MKRRCGVVLSCSLAWPTTARLSLTATRADRLDSHRVVTVRLPKQRHHTHACVSARTHGITHACIHARSHVDMKVVLPNKRKYSVQYLHMEITCLAESDAVSIRRLQHVRKQRTAIYSESKDCNIVQYNFSRSYAFLTFFTIISLRISS